MKDNNSSKLKLISTEDIMNFTNQNNILTKSASELFMAAFGYNKLNDIYQKLSDKSGYEFIETVLLNLGIQYKLEPNELKNIPLKGAFIVISNHPYGGLEGLILLKEFLKIRKDFKVLGNFLIRRVEQLKEFIIPIDSFELADSKKMNVPGMKAAIRHLKDGSPLLIFPAGEVSSYNTEKKIISDRKWMTAALKFIKKSSVPVLPIFFQGSNSIWFHSLGLIHPLLRTAKIPSELMNKKNKLIKIQTGRFISVKEQAEYDDIERFGRFLRVKTNLLSSSLEIKKFFSPSFPVKPEEIVPPADIENLKNEVENLPKQNLLFNQNHFSVYYAPSSIIPNVIYELGRLREITFREIGEGTNKKSDIDEYDLYYYHLFIWDNSAKTIAGAYRIGMGNEIINQYGKKGFYINSLFKIQKDFKTILSDSLELGRSFVRKEYQRNPLSLFLLWKGILQFLVQNPDYRYLIGPVSISNRYSKVLKSLIVKYIQENHFNGYLAQFIKPRKKFRVPGIGIDAYVLTENIRNLKDLDSVIKNMDPNNFKLPVLLKKYLELNGKIISFNIDPKFNDALDGLLVLDLYNVPDDSIRMLSKELDSIELMKRFNLKHPFDINEIIFESMAQL
jgi:putative hemolysin